MNNRTIEYLKEALEEVKAWADKMCADGFDAKEPYYIAKAALDKLTEEG